MFFHESKCRTEVVILPNKSVVTIPPSQFPRNFPWLHELRKSVSLTGKMDRAEAAYHAQALDHVGLWTAAYPPTWPLVLCL